MMKHQKEWEEFLRLGGCGWFDDATGVAHPVGPLVDGAISHAQLRWHRAGSKGYFDTVNDVAHPEAEDDVQAWREKEWRERGWTEDMIKWYRAGHKGEYLKCTASCCVSNEERKRFATVHKGFYYRCHLPCCVNTEWLFYHDRQGRKPALKVRPAVVGRMKRK